MTYNEFTCDLAINFVNHVFLQNCGVLPLYEPHHVVFLRGLCRA